jgi:hypothetical protein
MKVVETVDQSWDPIMRSLLSVGQAYELMNAWVQRWKVLCCNWT